MTDPTITSFITFNSPPTEEVLRLDKEGFHYRGQFIADAGEAHRLMVEFLKSNSLAPTTSDLIQDTRRPKSPSLKEQALEWMVAAEALHLQAGIDPEGIIRRALEQLDA